MTLAAGAARAQSVLSFNAQVDQSRVMVGEPITYTLQLSYTGSHSFGSPTAPDWGGLSVQQQASPQIQISMGTGISGTRTVQSWRWQVSAMKPGRYTIGPARLTVGGRTYQTQPIAINVQPSGSAGAYIMPAHTDDPQVNAQLRNRFFLRATVSDPTPYVGEPVVIAYTLFNSGINAGRSLNESVGNIPGAVVDLLFHASGSAPLPYTTRILNGRNYQAATLYKIAVIPNHPGELTVNGYGLSGMVGGFGRHGFGGGGFGDFFNGDPFMSGVPFELPPPPVQLNVRKLPDQGQPAGFDGNVGDFQFTVKADRTHMTEDDLLTLDMTVSGRGAIELANPPAMPAHSDFDRIEQTEKVKKQTYPDGIGGTKQFEWILRPNRSGSLTIPSIEYTSFDPFTSQYRVQRSAPIPVQVAPGAVSRVKSPNAPSDVPSSPIYNLSYLKSIGRPANLRHQPLFQRPTFWVAQLAALGLVLLAFRRDQRRAALDPAQRRRQNGWRQFERRIRALRQKMSGQAAPTPEVTAELEAAVRGLIADRFNVSADGLTRQEIEQHLLACAMPTVRVSRVCDLLEECAAVRFAPAGKRDGHVTQWISEFGQLLHEGLYP